METAAPPVSKIDRVRKLLAKAEDFGVTTAEAEAFTAKAAELMARYGIEQRMLDAADADAAPVRPSFQITVVSPPFHHQKKDMLVRVGDAMNLHPVTHHDPPPPELAGKYREQLSVELFGSPLDIQRAQVMYESLLAQATRLLREDLEVAGRGSAYKQSWLNGFAVRVSARIREQEHKAAYVYDTEHALTGTPKSAVLVLASWEDQVTAFRAAKYPRLGAARHRRSSGSGFGAGYQAGERATLGQAGVGAGPGRAITAGGR